MPRPFTGPLIATVLAVVGGPAAAQMFRCTQGGATVYQQTPCEGGRAIKPPSAPGDRPAPSASAASSAAQSVSGSASAPQVIVRQANPQPAPTGTRDANAMGRICMEWYRSGLRDPQGAYMRNPRRDGVNAVRMELFATNGFGGYVSREVLCEFKVGSLEIDDGWTKIHASRVRW